MLFWYLLILIISLIGLRIYKEGFYKDYLGKEQGNAIKGIFILLVFLGHALADLKNCGYVGNNWLDRSAYAFYSEMGQLVVAMFLFYSGYGVMVSLMYKGEAYLKTYPRSRLLTTILNFDIAVCCFGSMNLLLSRKMTFPQIILSFIGWESLGNSNWYIFIILCCYLVFYLVSKLSSSHYYIASFLISLILFIEMLILHQFKAAYWYNTILVFPAGVIYALHISKLERFIQRHYYLSLFVLLVAFLALHKIGYFHPLHGITHNVKSIIFCILIIAFTMKIHIGNPVLYWCGMNLFPLYIYQRLPMIVLEESAGYSWVCGHPSMFIGICFVITAGIAWLYSNYFRIKLV